MNYRHAFHAGNHADVLKHVVLRALIETLLRKPAPFCYLDTHAGAGSYRLAGAEATRTGEHLDGIARFHPADRLPPLVAHWRDAIWREPGNERGLVHYPGSPLQVARLLRPGDSAQLCELHAEEAASLRRLFHAHPQVHVHHRDGYEALKALLPPDEKRGLVLIDPPYEAQDAEYPHIVRALKEAFARWPTGIYAVWYPVKLHAGLQPFLRDLAKLPAKRTLRVELLVHPADTPLKLNGSGLAILNAPWDLDAVLREPLAALADWLQQDQPATTTLAWLRTETDATLNARPTARPVSLPRGPRRR